MPPLRSIELFQVGQMSCQNSWSGSERVEAAGGFGELLGPQTLLYDQSASIETKTSAFHTLAFFAAIGTRLLPLSHSFWVVVGFEGGLCPSRLLVDDITIWIAEDLRFC